MNGPHQGQQVFATGAPLESTRAAMVMVHGRGAPAQSILSLAPVLAREGFTYLAPQAAGQSWYPHGFMTPMEQNEPGLSSALQVIRDTLAHLAAAGVPAERTILLGFSQGGCLVTEFAAREPRRYGGVVGLSGGLIGPDETPRDYPGSLAGTPVFLGCSDVDGHIPAERVRLTGEVLGGMGAEVELRFYPGMAHTVNDEEVARVQAMMDALLETA